MAIVKNFWLKGASKRLAGAVIYKAGGQTIARELANEVSNPRTRSQMEQRVRWANCVAFYRANASWMRYAYESKKANQSEYNKFMSLNVANNRIYLTKQAAAAGACVVDNFIMTQGSLPSITYEFGQVGIRTNIFMPTEFEYGTGGPVSAWSRAILQNNPGVQEGDQISLIRYTQMSNEATGFPYVIVRKYEFIIDTTNSQPLSNYVPEDLWGYNEDDNKGWVEINNTGNSGGLLMVLSRTIGGRTLVSTQSILPVNNSSVISAWSSDSALNRAINSYGESEEAFLSSDSANYAEYEPIQLVPLSVTIEGVNYVDGDYMGELSVLDGKVISMNFNQDFRGNIQHIYIDTTQVSQGTIAQTVGSVVGQSVSWTVTKGNIGDNALIRAIRIETDQDTFRMDFETEPHNLE